MALGEEIDRSGLGRQIGSSPTPLGLFPETGDRCYRARGLREHVDSWRDAAALISPARASSDLKEIAATMIARGAGSRPSLPEKAKDCPWAALDRISPTPS